jgi:thioesterase-3
MSSQTEIIVRGYHADAYGHVNNARYLEFLEEGRWALLEQKIDLQKWAKQGRVFLVVNININYRKATAPGEILTVVTSIEKINRRSAVLKQLITSGREKALVVDALVTFVVVGATGRPLVIEGDLEEDLRRLLG